MMTLCYPLEFGSLFLNQLGILFKKTKLSSLGMFMLSVKEKDESDFFANQFEDAFSRCR